MGKQLSYRLKMMFNYLIIVALSFSVDLLFRVVVNTWTAKRFYDGIEKKRVAKKKKTNEWEIFVKDTSYQLK